MGEGKSRANATRGPKQKPSCVEEEAYSTPAQLFFSLARAHEPRRPAATRGSSYPSEASHSLSLTSTLRPSSIVQLTAIMNHGMRKNGDKNGRGGLLSWVGKTKNLIYVLLGVVLVAVLARVQLPRGQRDARSPEAANICREVTLTARGQGGRQELSAWNVSRYCEDVTIDGACEELKDFTGLTDDEFQKRMERRGRFHFEGEHMFWNPGSKTELAWYYSSSVDYLFGNVVHRVNTGVLDRFLKHETHEPVLDYSGGTGNNAIYLAKKGLRVQYFGIGMAEKAFARYRVERNGLQDLVEFKEPYTRRTGYTFDPINGPLPQDGSLGSILATDVLEHIPNYHKVVEKMVDSIRVGGVIIEHSPFGSEQESSDQGEPDVRIHVSTGGISMEEAMGPRMKKLNSGSYMNVWVKMMSK